MTAKPIFWSHSVLNSFETCPRRHYVTRVAKLVTEPQTEALRWGNMVHKALEDRQNGTAPLPATLAGYEPMLQVLMSKHGQRLVEARWAVDASFRPVGYKDRSAWCRSVVDSGIVGVDSAVLIDWKTGSRKPDSDQLKLSAAMAFAQYPHVEKVSTTFVWLKEKKLDKESFTREQVGEIWNEFLPRVARLEQAHKTNTWHPKPSGLCVKWCPVTKQHCEFGR
jgi:hypothetical protein